MLALDHRGSFEKLLKTGNIAGNENQIITIKRLLIESLNRLYSGILLDSKFGLPAYQEAAERNSGILAKPYLLAIEKSGYRKENGGRVTELEYSVEFLKKQGAKGVKILLYFHPQAATAGLQLRLTKKLLEECRQNSLPLFLEILTYPLNSHGFDLAASIIDSVTVFLENDIKPDVFKLEYPGNPEACQSITDLLSGTPWILLTKGVDFQTFKIFLRNAVTHGASGFLAGRSLWQDFIDRPQDKWPEFFSITVKERFQEITEIVTTG